MVDYAKAPAVHVFGDSAPALARMSATASAAGVRFAAAPAPGTAPDASMLVPGAPLLIELDAGTAEAALPLLALALSEAEAGARRSVISAPEGMIDLVAARAWHAGIIQLCQAEADERRAAIAWACERPGAELHDSRRERDFPILHPLADGGAAAQKPSLARDDAAFIRMLLRTRRLRSHFFRADLFADPAWDMLLDLMAARLEGKQVAVSSLCIAAAVPPTTALRWIGVLTENGLVVRVADRDDRRRVYVELGDATTRALGAWLQEARRMLREVP
jgi:DNA-binding transcriptional ArsR family regulator